LYSCKHSIQSPAWLKAVQLFANARYNIGMQPETQSSDQPSINSQEYRPELLSRRGEVVAWSLAILLAAVWLFLRAGRQPFLPAVTFLLGFFLFSAASISLGNWMDRRTVLRVDDQAVAFENGLRRARIPWQDIQEVQVFPSSWGKKVQVIGPQAHFAFRTLGEVRLQGDLKGRMGFAQGEFILEYILARSGLHKAPPDRPDQVGIVYSRR